GRAPVNVMMADVKISAASMKLIQRATNEMVGALGEIALQKMVGGVSTRIGMGAPGSRQYAQIDALVGGLGGIAHESKVGYIGSVSQLRGQSNQLGKYMELRATGQVKGVVYDFFRNPTTGKIGASQKVLDYLKKNGIDYKIHDKIDITKY